MSTAAWVTLDDPAVPGLLAHAFGLRFPPASAHRELTLDGLSRIARHNGFTMNVRAVNLPLGTDGGEPHLILRDGRFLTVLSRGDTWLLLDSNTRFIRIPERDVLALLATDHEREQLEAYRALMRTAGVSNGMSERVARRLGISRGNELARWLTTQGGAIVDAERFAKFALTDPHLLPLSWDPRAKQTEVREISFDRHMSLRSQRAFRTAALDLVRSEGSLLASLFGLVVVGIPIGYLLPVCMAYMIDRARNVGDAPTTVFVVLACALILAAVLGAVRSLAFVRLGARLRIRLLNAFLFRLLGCRIQRLRGLSDGDLSARLSDLFVAQQLLFGQTLPSVLSTLMLAGGLVYLGTVAPAFLIPLGAAGVLIGMLYAAIAPRLRALTRDRLATYSTWRERLMERFENWKLFRHFDPENGMLPRIDPILAATADLGQRGAVLGALLAWGTALIAMGFLGAAWSIGVRGYQDDGFSLGQFIVLMGLALGTFRGMEGLASLVTAWVRAEPSIRRLRELVEHTEPESDLVGMRGDGSQQWSGLAIEDLSFAWPERAPILSRLSLTVAPSEWVAIVGRSGSGKSTLAYVLGGLIEASDGAIRVGGAERGVLDLDDLRRHIAVVPQEPTLFDATLKENILTGLTSVTDEALSRAVELSDLSAFVQKRRRGLDEFVGENGSQVSVGEKVRIAMARALVREPDLLVLDESFGHLDEGTALRIGENLRRAKVAVILLTHDETLARRCDRQYALHDGRLGVLVN